jgi:hypothetical protein
MHVFLKNPFSLNLWSYNPSGLVGQKTNYKKHGFMSSSPLKRTFDFFGNHLITFENQQFFGYSLVLGIYSKISRLEFAFVVSSTHPTSES